MDFYTTLNIPREHFDITLRDKILLTGSCFVENIGLKLHNSKFAIDLNPFGILYNPSSISKSIYRLLDGKPYNEADLFLANGQWSSFDHHSKFSSSNVDETLSTMNERLHFSSAFLRSCTRIIITFGTAFVYQEKDNGRIVSNCHKLPEKLFTRSILSVQDIVQDWESLLNKLTEMNPLVKFIFTVSPIRHWKDGAHGNQLSKATLLLAINELQQKFPQHISYFPSYEIMMDELRDYRFYASDMIHPSDTAIEYIWEKFSDTYFDKETISILSDWSKLRKAMDHRPFQAESDVHKQFVSQTLLKMKLLIEKFPFFDISKEIDEFTNKI